MTKPTTEIILRHTEEITSMLKRIDKLEQAVALITQLHMEADDEQQ